MCNILRTVAKDVGNVINAVPGGQYIADAAAAATGNPELIPLISGASETAKTGSLGSGLLSAGGSYLGSQLGGSLLGNLGTVGSALGDTTGNAVGSSAGDNVGTFVGDTVGNGAGSSAANAVSSNLGDLFGSDIGSAAGNAVSNLASTPLNSAIGGAAGGLIGGSLGPQKSGSIGASAFVPSQQASQALPSDLSQFSGLDPNQQESNIATQGVYGGGLGSADQSYFTNLINRQLVNGNGQTNPVSSLSPIENSYLNNLGLGGYTNSNNLLQAISSWTPQ